MGDLRRQPPARRGSGPRPAEPGCFSIQAMLGTALAAATIEERMLVLDRKIGNIRPILPRPGRSRPVLVDPG